MSPIETSETQSPQIKRRQKHSRNNEKENDSSSVIEAFRSPKKTQQAKQQKHNTDTRAKLKNDFTVDIFTTKTSEEREKERNETLQSTEEQVCVYFIILLIQLSLLRPRVYIVELNIWFPMNGRPQLPPALQGRKIGITQNFNWSYLHIAHWFQNCVQINQSVGENESWFLIGWESSKYWESANEKPVFIFPHSLIYLSTVLESVDQM